MRDDPRHPGPAAGGRQDLSADRLQDLVPAEVELELDVVEQRRKRLYVVGGVAAFGSAVIASVVLAVDGVELPPWVGWALLATTALFLVDAAMQERTLSELTRTLLAQRQRGVELEATVGDLAALLSVARRVNSVLLPEEVYDVVVEAAVDLLRADTGSIRLRVGEMLAVAASTGDDAPAVGTVGRLEDDPAVVVLTLGTDVVETDPPRLAFPVTVGRRHVGVLELQRAADGPPFSARSALLGRLFAEEVAGAVVNANRFDLERSRVEELHSDRETRSDAVADVVHDLRVPLSSVLAWSELLRDRHDRLDEAQREEALAGVVEAAGELRGLIDEVFDQATAEAQAIRVREEVDLAEVVEAAARAARSAQPVAGAQVHVQVEGEPRVLADPDALRRVVTNLLVNALEHGSPEVRVRVQERRREVRIHVSDRGAGIPSRDLPDLFTRRPRGDESPRGRGLAIVDTLVRAMGGRVGVRSQVGLGSVFTVVLPRVGDDPA